MTDLDPAHGPRIASLLGLQPLPHEGGRYRQSFADGHSTAIFYLLTAGNFSALHRLTSTEVYHHYAGAPLRLLLLDEATGRHTEPVLGSDIPAGQRPQLAVAAGIWQGSAPLGPWSLIGTTMAPPFSWDGFQLGAAGVLCARFPEAAERIRELSRTE